MTKVLESLFATEYHPQCSLGAIDNDAARPCDVRRSRLEVEPRGGGSVALADSAGARVQTREKVEALRLLRNVLRRFEAGKRRAHALRGVAAASHLSGRGGGREKHLCLQQEHFALDLERAANTRAMKSKQKYTKELQRSKQKK